MAPSPECPPGLTSNFALGFVVPIPTLSPRSMVLENAPLNASNLRLAVVCGVRLPVAA